LLCRRVRVRVKRFLLEPNSGEANLVIDCVKKYFHDNDQMVGVVIDLLFKDLKQVKFIGHVLHLPFFPAPVALFELTFSSLLSLTCGEHSLKSTVVSKEEGQGGSRFLSSLNKIHDFSKVAWPRPYLLLPLQSSRMDLFLLGVLSLSFIGF
jgi:hypothetical protein